MRCQTRLRFPDSSTHWPFYQHLYDTYLFRLQGDSGGAWVCEVNNKWTLVAIQSYGIAAYGIANNDCRDGIRAGTRISHYNDWIKSFTKSRRRVLKNINSENRPT